MTRKCFNAISRNASCGPKKWLKALEKVEPRFVLPAHLGGQPEQGFMAWKGDKLLGAATVQVVMELEAIEDEGAIAPTSSAGLGFDFSEGYASSLAATALSNAFMASRVPEILPMYADYSKALGDHQIGTMLEAAVAKVNETDKDAVLDLALWLIRQAHKQPRANAKGSLLEAGGSVNCARVGGPDHSAIFEATATLGESSISVRGSQKRKAEQLAAEELLSKIGRQPSTTMKNVVVVEQQKHAGSWDHTKMNPFESISSVTLHDGESLEEWWLRGAMKLKDSFRRASLAPAVFPHLIKAVDTWILPREGQNNDSKYAAFMLVISQRVPGAPLLYELTQVVQGSSKTEARRKVGILANELIARQVGVSLE